MSIHPHILCVSLNPAVDRRIVVPSLRLGEVNRARTAVPTAGGKAAHVAFAARALGANVRWLAFLGGPEGESCRVGVEARGVETLSVPISGRTRSTMDIFDESTGVVTEVLEPGPTVSLNELGLLLRSYRSEVHPESIVVLSGSLPAGVDSSFYAELVTHAKQVGAKVLVDTSGEALSKSLEVRPSLIKPNRQEASALLGREIQSVDDAFHAADELRARGPESVVLSLGAEGAIATDPHGTWFAGAPKVEGRSAVGSGDSFLGGWAVAMSQGAAVSQRLRLAIACGAANCLADEPGVLKKSDVESLFQQIKITEKPAVRP